LNPEYTDDEKMLLEQLNFDLDPQLRQVLYRESTGSGNNIYAQESMDFVKQIQANVQNYFDERNLYYAGLSTDDIAQSKLIGLTQEQRNLLMGEETILDPLASAFVEASRQAGEQRKAQQKLREDIIREQEGKRKPTTEEKVKTTKTSSSSPSPAPKPAPRPSPPKGKRKAKGEL